MTREQSFMPSSTRSILLWRNCHEASLSVYITLEADQTLRIAMTKAPFFAVACLLFADTGWATECSLATVRGIYNYSYAGYAINSDKTVTRFAVAGLDQFNGDGTLSGVSTATIEGQQAERLVKYTGIYKVNPDCTISETDTDQTGAVFHYDGFTTPKGDSISFVETDPDVVVSGTEHR
jgi:hypothetical protein